MAGPVELDDMLIEWDAEIVMDDGLVLRADVFRPMAVGQWPVLLTYGPYAKGLAFQKGYPSAWQAMIANHPDVAYGSTNKYQNWEVVDPEKWVPHGYACVRVDSRGTGRSPGYVDHFSPRETRDFYQCIEWAGVPELVERQCRAQRHLLLRDQPVAGGFAAAAASEGDVHLGGCGRLVSRHDPPWRHSLDVLGQLVRHAGQDRAIWPRRTGAAQPGHRRAGLRRRDDVGRELARNRSNFGDEILAHPLDDDYHKARSPDWDKVTVPFLSAANWGGQGLHPRGNFEGFVRAASKEKWLECHGLEHWTHFYTDYGRTLQKRFFDFYLKGDANDWPRQPRVQLQVRHLDRFVERHESAWPLPSTAWTKFYLDPADQTLSLQPPAENAEISFAAMGDGLTFVSGR